MQWGLYVGVLAEEITICTASAITIFSAHTFLLVFFIFLPQPLRPIEHDKEYVEGSDTEWLEPQYRCLSALDTWTARARLFFSKCKTFSACARLFRPVMKGWFKWQWRKSRSVHLEADWGTCVPMQCQITNNQSRPDVQEAMCKCDKGPFTYYVSRWRGEGG